MSDEMRELVADLVAEQDSLDRAVQSAPLERWLAASPADGWLMRDCIAHLAEFDDTAARVASGGDFRAGRATAPGQPPLSAGQVEARALSIPELLARWRDARRRLSEAMSPLDP